MDCRIAIEYINLYADGMLGKKETGQLLSHIGSCGKCKKDFDDIVAVKRALSGLGEIEPPAGLALSAIRKAKKRKIPVFAYASAGIAAVIALAAVFSSNIFNNSNEMRQDKAAYPSVYSQDIAGRNGAQAECAPEAPYFGLASAPQATAVPKNEGEIMDSGSVAMRSASVTFIDVPAENSEDFRQALEKFLTGNIEYKKFAAGDRDTISFEITEEKLDELKLLINESFQYEGELNAGDVEFIFNK